MSRDTAPGLDELLDALNAGRTIPGGSPLHAVMHRVSQDALRLTAELNGAYCPPERVRELLSEITGTTVDESVTVFPPFSTDFGRNLTLGRDVFVNAGCKIQDQGGVTIGDGCLLGHNAVLTTLDHDLDPRRRADMHPAPVVLGRAVWLGANVTVLPGVTIGDGAVVGAGAVVTRDVPAGTVAVGVPARVVRSVSPEGNDAGPP
ncbi:DapH/DapD/GlmU-related protein [Cellulosimicrobium sp. CUA-896]|uniref:DapH/DapD/GlmU-related protein n=1 Tax=Cellulosimicrobium sp. CUA-896 TaxID=1517881 RepID=UPI000967D213|nr:DapH/DapD/GlmU-related protein [Cellulosimicrobium sp. CUA-896]OLT51729.1 acetyltransferase [Cellulosimicrobium sp. CUA-896]